jgi:hypothetical protein
MAIDSATTANPVVRRGLICVLEYLEFWQATRQGIEKWGTTARTHPGRPETLQSTRVSKVARRPNNGRTI